MVDILSVEDSGFQRKLLKQAMDEDYDFAGADTAEEGLKKFKNENPELVLLDIRLPDRSGLKLLEDLVDLDEDVKVLVVSIVREDETIEEAKDLGALDYIEKPVDEEELAERVDEVI